MLTSCPFLERTLLRTDAFYTGYGYIGILLKGFHGKQQNIEGVERFLFYYCEYGSEELVEVEVEVKLESVQIHHTMQHT